MDEVLRESYRTLENRLFHEGRFVTPSFIEANNMLPSFQAIGLEPFLTLNEPICPRFVAEFYHSFEVKRDEEEHPYIEFKLGQFTFKSTRNLIELDMVDSNGIQKELTAEPYEGDSEIAEAWFDQAAEYWKQAIALTPGHYIEALNWLKITRRFE
ncbi:hypothetical protein Tco_1398647 [Tanacetum coccineum]